MPCHIPTKIDEKKARAIIEEKKEEIRMLEKGWVKIAKGLWAFEGEELRKEKELRKIREMKH